MDIDLLLKHFPRLSEVQQDLFIRHAELFLDWNSKINLISRKDTDQFIERHVLHSLGIAKVMTFQPGSKVLDIGTGGGFPGIPLAILFPEVEFVLCDSIAKKVMVVNELKDSLGLSNVRPVRARAEEIKEDWTPIELTPVLQVPALAVPVGKTSDGMPCGAQFIGPKLLSALQQSFVIAF